MINFFIGFGLGMGGTILAFCFLALFHGRGQNRKVEDLREHEAEEKSKIRIDLK